MLGRWQHRVAIAVAVAGAELAVGLGGGRMPTAGLGLAAALGGVVATQGDQRTIVGPTAANVIVGFAAGTVVCVAVTAAVLMATMAFPWDVAIWRSGIQTWGAWTGVAAVLVSGYFVAALVASVR